MEQGDFVCFRTGFDQVLLEIDRKPDESVHDVCAVLDGRDARLQQWVTDCGAVALISDNYAVKASLAPVRPRRRPLRLAAAARALPVPARRLSRRDLVPERARRLAARPSAIASCSPRRRCGCPARSVRRRRRSATV